jgi:hypothetical protein
VTSKVKRGHTQECPSFYHYHLAWITVEKAY